MLRACLSLSLVFLVVVSARIVEDKVLYTLENDEVFEASVAYDDRLGDDLPAVLLIHQFFGVSQSEEYYARFFAEQGFYAFAGDIYGARVRPTTFDEAIGNATFLNTNPEIMRLRANGALDALLAQPQVNASGGAVAGGYCLGADITFELARTNPMGLRGAVGFHGSERGLSGALGLGPAIPQQIWVQYHHSAEDASTSDQNVFDFQQQLKATGNEVWSTHTYSDAQHGYTNPFSDVYQQRAAEQAHDLMLNMLEELHPDRQTEPIRRGGGRRGGGRRGGRSHLPRPRDWEARRQEVSSTHDSNFPARGRGRRD